MTSPSPDEKTTDRLLACPHCGGDAMPWSGDWDDNSPDYTKREYFVNCGTCHAQTDRHPSEAQAVAAWNRRTPAQSLTASLERVKELEKELELSRIANQSYRDTIDTLRGDEAQAQFRVKALEKELAEEKRLRQELRHIANAGGAEMSNLCDVFIDEKNRYKAECERLQADLEAAEKEKARIKRESHNCYEDCVSKLDANQRIATEQERVMQLVCIPMIEQKEAEFAQSLTLARAEAIEQALSAIDDCEKYGDWMIRWTDAIEAVRRLKGGSQR